MKIINRNFTMVLLIISLVITSFNLSFISAAKSASANDIIKIEKPKTPEAFDDFTDFKKYIKYDYDVISYNDYKGLNTEFQTFADYIDYIMLSKSDFKSENQYNDYCKIISCKLWCNNLTDIDECLKCFNYFKSSFKPYIDYEIFAKEAAVYPPENEPESKDWYHYWNGNDEKRFLYYLTPDGEDEGLKSYQYYYSLAPDDYETYEEFVEACERLNVNPEDYINGNGPLLIKKREEKENYLPLTYKINATHILDLNQIPWNFRDIYRKLAELLGDTIIEAEEEKNDEVVIDYQPGELVIPNKTVVIDILSNSLNAQNNENTVKEISSTLSLSGNKKGNLLRAITTTKKPKDFSTFNDFIKYLKELPIEGAYKVDYKALGFKSRSEYVDSLFLSRKEFSSDSDWYDYCLIFGIKLFNETPDVDKSISFMKEMIDGMGGEVEIEVYALTGNLVEKGYFDENSPKYFGGQGEEKYKCFVDADGEEVSYVLRYQPAPDDFDTYEDYVKYCNKHDLRVEFPDSSGKYGKSSGKKTYVAKRRMPDSTSLSVRFGMRTQFVTLDKSGYMNSDFVIKNGVLLQRNRKYKNITKINVGVGSKIIGISDNSIKIQVKSKSGKFSEGKWNIPFKTKDSLKVPDLSKKSKI